MSARPARNISKVDAYTNKAGEPRCVVTLDDGEKVALTSLSRAEVLRAAKIAFPEVSGKAWFRVTTSVAIDAIRTKTVPADLDVTGKSVTSKVDPLDPAVPIVVEPDETPAEPARAPQAAPKAPQSHNAADDLAAAIQALLPEPTPSVDEAQIKALVEAHVDQVLTTIPALKVEIAGVSTKALPGQRHPLLTEAIQVLSAGCHLFLVGPAGSGKSTIAEQAASAITTESHPEGLPFGAISFGPTTPTSKLFGYNDANGHYVGTAFRAVWEHGGVFLGDELDNGHPGLIAELNQALANGYAAFADQVIPRHPDFRFVATGNTFGKGPDRQYVGRNILDAATLDRFVIVEVDYDEALEQALALGYADESTVDATRKYVALVRSVRKSVRNANLPLIVSPRAAIDGAKLIRQGISPERVAEIRLYAGWSSEHRDKAGV